MYVDPNKNVNTTVEHILIEQGKVSLPDGSVIEESQLDSGETELDSFCKSLDPNLCFISAYVISNDDEPLFYKVRNITSKHGIHCQAGREKESVMRRQWNDYLFAKQHTVKTTDPDSGDEGVDAGSEKVSNDTLKSEKKEDDTDLLKSKVVKPLKGGKEYG